MAKQQQKEPATAKVEEVHHEAHAHARDLVGVARHTATEVGDRAAGALHAAAAKVPAINPSDLVHAGRERLHEVTDRANDATRAASSLIEETSGRVAANLERGGTLVQHEIAANLDNAPQAAGALAARARRNPLPAVLIVLALVALVVWLIRRA